jgi:hypothetical protein
MNENRAELAEEFLREAVYRSRASQAVSTLLAQGAALDRGQCGLGEKAAVALDLSPRGRELFEQLFTRSQARGSSERQPASSARSESGAGDSDDARGSARSEDQTLARIQSSMRAWIETQDALDRKRNHFLKAFRNAHGFDRTKYTPSETSELDSGLTRINDEENRERRSAALSLLQD